MTFVLELLLRALYIRLVQGETCSLQMGGNYFCLEQFLKSKIL